MNEDEKYKVRKELLPRMKTAEYKGCEITRNPHAKKAFSTKCDGEVLHSDDLDDLLARIDHRLSLSRKLEPVRALQFGLGMHLERVRINSITADMDGVNAVYVFEKRHGRVGRVQITKREIKTKARRSTAGIFKDHDKNLKLMGEIRECHRQIAEIEKKKVTLIGHLDRYSWEFIESRRIKPKKGG